MDQIFLVKKYALISTKSIFAKLKVSAKILQLKRYIRFTHKTQVYS